MATNVSDKMIVSDLNDVRATAVVGLNIADQAVVTVISQPATDLGELDIAVIFLDLDGVDRLIEKLQNVRKLMTMLS